MIRLFKENETVFDHNETVLQPLQCVVTEEENAAFELEFESLTNPMIAAGAIIQAPTPRGAQLFRVYKSIHTLRKTKAKARHIFYDLANNWLEDVRPTSTNGAGAVAAILSGALYAHRFSGSSTVANVSSAYYIRKNLVRALIGDENSLINRWGGFVKRDNFMIHHLAAGRDLGYEIRYGKNLKGIEVELDDSKVVTALMPTWVDSNNVVQMLPEKYVNSPLINTYPQPKVAELRVDIPEGTSDVAGYVRAEALKQYSVGNIDVPLVNYKIDFVTLQQLPEYQHYLWTEALDLYDTVDVIVEKMDISITSSVIKYSYDCIQERFLSIEIGNFSNSLARNTANAIKQIETKINVKSEEVLTKQQQIADRITGATGGNVVTRFTVEGKPYETLWMDTDNIATAKDVVRINKLGIGVSTTGYNGPFAVAFTAKDGLYADYIFGLIVKAAMIETGAITADKLAAGAITADKIAASAITSEKIQAGAIQASKIAAGAITADKIQSNSLTSAQINTTELLGANATFSGKVSAAIIEASTINISGAQGTFTLTPQGGATSNYMASNYMTANNMTANNMAANGGQFNNITANNITANNMAMNSGSIGSGVYIGPNMYVSQTGIRLNCGGRIAVFENSGNAWLGIYAGNPDYAGNVIWAVTQTGQVYTSDRRLKDEIVPYPPEDILSMIASLRLAHWNWKRDGTPDIGVVADDIEAALPPEIAEHIVVDMNGYKAVRYDLLGALALGAIPALMKRIEHLEEMQER